MKKQLALITSAAMIFSSAASYAAFTDVGEESPYFQAVNSLVEKNIAQGYPDGSFMPDKPMTYGELTAMIRRATGEEYDESVFLQTDAVDINDAVRRIRFTAGLDPLDPLPKRLVTRGEVAQMIYDAFVRESVENISYILNNICVEPHPIGTQAIEDVKDFLSDYLQDCGYEVELQDFGYLKESITDKETLFGDEYVFAPGSQAQDGVATNIIARKKAAVDTDKTVIISAHYDTTSKVVGAIDNGSGVSAAAELARRLAYEKLGYNLEIIFFSAEELNLGGSKYFAKTLSPEEAGNVLFNINIDCVGENNSYYPEVWTNHGLGELNGYIAENYPEQIELFEKSKALVSSLTPVLDKYGIETNPEMMPASDHVSLEQIGIPAMVLYQRNDRQKVWEDEEAEKLDNIDVDKISYTVDVVKAILMYKDR